MNIMRSGTPPAMGFEAGFAGSVLTGLASDDDGVGVCLWDSAGLVVVGSDLADEVALCTATFNGSVLVVGTPSFSPGAGFPSLLFAVDCFSPASSSIYESTICIPIGASPTTVSA